MSEHDLRSEASRPAARGPWKLWIAIVAGAVALYAIFGFLVVPRIVRWQIVKQSRERLSRQATVERVRFNPFTFVTVVEGLQLRDRDGAALSRFDRLTADFELSGLFRRAWRFRQFVIENPRAVVRIAPDGRPSIADLFEDKAAEKPPGPPSHLPRIIVDHFAVRGGRAELVDESRTPSFVQSIAPLDLELHQLTTIPEENGDHTIVLGFGDSARLRWSGRQTVEPLRFVGRVEITGVGLPRAWDYIAPKHALVIRDGRIDVACAYDAGRAADGLFSVAISEMGVSVHDLAVGPRTDEENWLVAPLVEVRGAKVLWPESRAEVGEVRVTGPRALAWLDEAGRVNWQDALAPEPADAAPEVTDTTKAWTATVRTVEIVEASAHVEDRSVEPDVVVDLTDVAVTLENLTNDLSASIPARLSARINGAGETSASGTVVPDPFSVDVEVKARGLELQPFKPYAVHLPWADFRRGVAGAEGRLRLGTDSPMIQFDGAVDLSDLQIAGPETDRLLACEKASGRGVRVTVFPERIRIASLDLDGGFAKLDIDREGNINLRKIFAAEGAQPSAPAASEPLLLDITTVAIRNTTLEYTDRSLILPFDTKIHSVNGSIRDLSTTAAAAGRLSLEGRVAETGYFKADGSLRFGTPFASTDIGVIFRGVDMPALTPYSAEFAGYSIEKGVLDVDVRYRIQDGRLVGEHHVVAKDLVLGPKVEGAKGPGLPVRLAVALLKDKDGRIDLQVPIEGTVDSPEFNYRSVFWQAFKIILGNVVKAPFRAIGRLFGAGDEDLELVGFASGGSALPAPEQEKLAKIRAELAQRQEISLEVEGRYDPVTDADAIRRARLEERIDSKREGAPSLESILETLYVETFSAERLEAERRKFLPEAAAPAAEQPKKKSKKKAPPPPPEPPREAFDAAGFYDALRAELLTSVDVTDGDLGELARARAASIAAALTAPGGLDQSRVKLLDPAPVKRKKQGSELVPSEMTMTAKD